MPLYHIGGLAIVLRSALYGTSVVLHSDFDARAVLHSLQHDRISTVSLVPTMLARLLDASGDAQFPTSLRFVLLGGGPIPMDLVLRARRARVPIAASYGLTEAASQVATLAPAEDEAHLGSVGQALPGVELRIVDENGRDQPAEVAGEIRVRAAQVMSGYLNLPEQTARTLEAGWLHTGDIGTLSTEGYLTLLDRRSDLIVSGGENVYPAEVEAVLLCHPDVAAAAVVGRSDPSWGQVVHAFVVPRAARAASAEELIAHCRSRLAGFKLPRVIELVTSLPQAKPGRLRRETWKAKN
jgi:O-succinylbenzoic acid--CoA ligase